MQKEFTINLAAARTNANLTQKQEAEILGVSRSTVVSWETGKTEPSMTELKRISELSGIPMDFIFVPEISD